MAGRWCRKLTQDVFRPMDIEQDVSVSAFVRENDILDHKST